jgi:alkanesulfonate monooxygenase SsuD/methylene tetrahydromethanopterin reductase-like flavin-dependent oxidoreductase (luciferase family)
MIEVNDLPVSELIERARLAEEFGMDSAWLIQLPNVRDSASLLTAMAMVTSRVSLGAAILPTYTRPPVVMAQTAATIDELSGGRFTLGVGTGHRLTAEWALGVPQGPPVPATREYVQIVRSLLRTGEVHFDGKYYKGHARYSPPLRPDMLTCLGALNPRMLELAGEISDGLLLWTCPAEYVRDVAIPRLRKGLERSGRSLDGFPVVMFLPSAVSDDLDHDIEWLRGYLQNYVHVPHYRKMYEASGYAHAIKDGRLGDELLHAVAAIGSEDDVSKRIAEYRAAGATEVVVSPMASAHMERPLWHRTLQAAQRG